MPAIVARGRAPKVLACGYCHRADGSGGPENATLSGLSAEYMTRQVADFRSGARTGSEPLRLPTATMAAVVRAATDSEIAVAVRYFAAQRYLPHVTVVESDTVPPIRISGWLLVAADGPWEPVGQRIIEIPDDQEQFERRDTDAQRTAWVPPGSIARGKAIVASVNCASCHGPGLRGLEPAPALAGRSPVYIVRQLYDFKAGVRAGSMSAPMVPIASQLSLDDMIAVASYVATLSP